MRINREGLREKVYEKKFMQLQISEFMRIKKKKRFNIFQLKQFLKSIFYSAEKPEEISHLKKKKSNFRHTQTVFCAIVMDFFTDAFKIPKSLRREVIWEKT
jgi:hypothetical protein